MVGAEGFEPPASCSQTSLSGCILSTDCIDFQPLTRIRDFCFRSAKKSFEAKNLGFWNSIGTMKPVPACVPRVNGQFSGLTENVHASPFSSSLRCPELGASGL